MASANVTYTVTITGGNIAGKFEENIVVADELSASELAAQIVALVNEKSSKVNAVQGADDDTFTISTDENSSNALVVSVTVAQ